MPALSRPRGDSSASGLASRPASRKARPRPTCPAGKLCLEYGNGADPTSLDPQIATATNEAAILRELFEGMYADEPDGRPIPGVAETRPEVSPDGLTWTFHLRPEVWSDGQPVTANDFVFAYRRMLDPKTGSILRLPALCAEERRGGELRARRRPRRWAPGRSTTTPCS